MPRTVAVVPSYCSWENLERHLPPLLEELRPVGVPIVVSDDASPDDTANRVVKAFPEVTLLRRDANGGFGENCNWAIGQVEAERVLLLNADVCVRPGFLQPLEAALAGDVFAVSAVAVGGDGGVEDGARLGRMKRGLLRWQRLDLDALGGTHVSAYPVGAHVLLDRARFLELGGFDPLYRPYYWEDVDLGYRAWKRGWRVLVEPASHVEHRREGSDIERTQGVDHVDGINVRNRLLFHWANLHDPGLFWGRHVAPLVWKTLTGWLALDARYYRALRGAFGRRGEARAARRRNRAAATRADHEVLALLEAELGETRRRPGARR